MVDVGGELRPECDRGTGHCGISFRPWSTVVSVGQVRLSCGVRVGNFPQNMQRRLRGKPPRLHHRIQRDLQRPPRPQSPRLRLPGNLIGNLIAQHQRRFQRRELIRTGYEFDHDNPFHFALNTFDGRGAFTAPMPTRCHQIMTEGSDKSGVPSRNSTATPSRALRWEFTHANNCGATTSGRRILRRAASGARCRSLPHALPSEMTRLANHTHLPPKRPRTTDQLLHGLGRGSIPLIAHLDSNTPASCRARKVRDVGGYGAARNPTSTRELALKGVAGFGAA